MTRVLLCHQPTDGGVGRHIADLALGLTDRGYDVVLAGPSAPLSIAGAVAHVPLDLGRSIEPRADAAAVLSLVGILDDLRPDIVHAHSSKAGAVARLAKLRRPRTPLVYTAHGYAFAGYFARSAHRIVYREVERALAPLASRVVCVCEAEARRARSIGAASRVRVVHNGIDSPVGEQLDPRVVDLSRRGPVIGALTLLRPGKGLETLIDAVPHVLNRRADIQVAIFGEGPDLGALRSRARRLGVADAVRFAGASATPEAALAGLDVFVHPSWAEAFPYVILEAMAAGRPIVASDVGGIGEALTDRVSGRLVNPRDECALARALIELLDEPQRAAEMGRQALRVVSRFSAHAMIDRLTAVYDELMRSSPGTLIADDPQSRPHSAPSPRAMAGPAAR